MERLDKIVAKEFNLARDKAQELIKAGKVTVSEVVVTKPAALYDVIKVQIDVQLPAVTYVSRGGDKLASAMADFAVSVTDKICLDIGASTGGFTDYLLQNGASHVYAVDVGTNQLHPSLHHHPQITSLENTDIRNLPPEVPLVDLAVMDVSFISLTQVLEVAYHQLRLGGYCICLVKPQFEAGSKHLTPSGVVRNKNVHQNVMKKVKAFATQCGFEVVGNAVSTLLGKKGNVEYFYCLKKV